MDETRTEIAEEMIRMIREEEKAIDAAQGLWERASIQQRIGGMICLRELLEKIKIGEGGNG